MESRLQQLERQEQELSAALDNVLEKYKHLKIQSESFDSTELLRARLSVRRKNKQAVFRQIEDIYEGKLSPSTLLDSKNILAELLHEVDAEWIAKGKIQQKLRQHEMIRNSSAYDLTNRAAR